MSIQDYHQKVMVTNIYNIKQLSAIWLFCMAWNSITEATIINCWNHTKILSNLNNIPDDFGLVQADASLEEATLELQDIGLITQNNWISISEFLNPINKEEVNINKLLTPEEVFNEKEANSEELEENDSNEHEPLLPFSPISEVKKAFVKILNHLSHSSSKEADDLTANLDAYTRILEKDELNAMKQTTMLDYLKNLKLFF
ncbi:hypothetical protein O181_045717 [Austropuccinia psidii MF-1]|uniref:DDE-1 domain-containing protein n=1 Tax=Austropuccinia psidii MF-1 TaxID=1389203 RepID=A0A9Q3DPW6_9BASI|nr:hypothetical protein [Austropuccinia psidii MF-1]